MCDDFTREAEDEALARRGLSRRDFAALGAGVAMAGCAATSGGMTAGGNDISEAMVQITTADGIADGFFVHPVDGAHPGIVMWPDIAGLREAKKIMARRLAAAGYAVLCVNQYYRGGPPPLDSFSDWRTPEGQAKIKPMREALTPQAVTRDAKAYVAFLDGEKAVDKARGIGSNGYCMGGPFTVRTAAADPSRVKAAASLHGGGLVTDEPDSPHKLLAQTQAAYLFAIARNDDAKSPGDKEALRKAADAAGVKAEIEVYDADHGWCVPDSPSYDPNAADRAWDRMLALFSGL
jgi:carboxymethylenebutenolidase